jgi:hypothetical protein
MIDLLKNIFYVISEVVLIYIVWRIFVYGFFISYFRAKYRYFIKSVNKKEENKNGKTE